MAQIWLKSYCLVCVVLLDAIVVTFCWEETQEWAKKYVASSQTILLPEGAFDIHMWEENVQLHKGTLELALKILKNLNHLKLDLFTNSMPGHMLPVKGKSRITSDLECFLIYGIGCFGWTASGKHSLSRIIFNLEFHVHFKKNPKTRVKHWCGNKGTCWKWWSLSIDLDGSFDFFG